MQLSNGTEGPRGTTNWAEEAGGAEDSITWVSDGVVYDGARELTNDEDGTLDRGGWIENERKVTVDK